MTAPIGFGIDLSHHQNPASLPWESYRGKVDFVFARATYGSYLHDETEVEHVRHARAIGAKIGIYSFYRSIHTVQAQFDALRMMAGLVGLGEGDIVPAIDVERDPLPAPGRDVSPSWSAACEEFCGLVAQEYGNALVYVTQREWRQLGSPEWALHYPQWNAHYINASKPASPAGILPTIWQHRVGAVDPNGPGGYFPDEHPCIDQNRLLQPLPLIGSRVTSADRERVAGLVSLSLANLAAEAADTDPPPPESVA